MRDRSTTRSRTSGNLVIGSIVIGSPFGESTSTSAEHACRTRPLITIEHAPHTSSRHTASQQTGATSWPAVVVGYFCTCCRALMTFMFGR